jgi:hypothetical protein
VLLLRFKCDYLANRSEAPKCRRAAESEISIIGTDVEDSRDSRQRLF